MAEAHRRAAERAAEPKTPPRKRALAEQCVLRGPQLQHGLLRQFSHFAVVTYDHDGVALTSGGERVRLAVQGPHPLRSTVTDRGDGTYAVTYFATFPGVYTLRVFCNSMPVPGSPLLVSVGALSSALRSTCAAMCVVAGRHAREGTLKREVSLAVRVRLGLG